ncbi:LapA family protein [Marinospirillum sp. MEB164]|uniref:LapA family protein n=1 Tax=Marinospirillum alkalitolerans TaxID=3123374 RepID=A0ABW8PXW3_9GAMM
MLLIKRLSFSLVLLACVVFGLLFSIRNQTLVTLDLLIFTLPEASLALIIIGAVLIGTLIGWLLILPYAIKSRAQKAKLQRELKLSQKELHQLRTLSLKSYDQYPLS